MTTDLLFVSYARWCTAYGEPVLEEAKVLATLRDHGASVRTGVLTQTALVVGVRVVL